MVHIEKKSIVYCPSTVDGIRQMTARHSRTGEAIVIPSI